MNTDFVQFQNSFIAPNWPAPARVRAFITTRQGGVSRPPFDSLNLSIGVEDDVEHVQKNRRMVEKFLPSPACWLKQVHGNNVVCGKDFRVGVHADALVTEQENQVCAILTADCLPVLFCHLDGHVVGAAHAGWRGLAAGVLENTLHAMNTSAAKILAYIGPAIGPIHFQVGADVRDSFLTQDEKTASYFQPDALANKWRADLPGLARHRLKQAGVASIYSSNLCTYSQAELFFSYRRSHPTGCMSSFLWIASC